MCDARSRAVHLARLTPVFVAIGVTFACATAAPPPPPATPPPQYVSTVSPEACVVLTSSTLTTTDGLATTSTLGADLAVIPDEPPAEDEDAPTGEEEARDTGVEGPSELRYTRDINDEELKRRWKDELEALGSISIGYADEGRLINGEQFPIGDGTGWTVVSPATTWATAETVAYVVAAIERVKALHPTALPLRVNEMSGKEGGYLRPHKSHQNGRDVDLAFYYPTAERCKTREREKVFDVAPNWELVKSLAMLTDVQVILADRRVQKVLYDYALGRGEDRAWLDSLFNAGPNSLVKHARRHRDHFHVRFFNPRAQELGRRVAPMLAERPDQNMVMVRVRKGDTLGRIALRHGSSISRIQKANKMRNTFLRLGRVLRVPLRGPCTKCPVPPAVEVPPRRLPPPSALEATAQPASQDGVGH